MTLLRYTSSFFMHITYRKLIINGTANYIFFAPQMQALLTKLPAAIENIKILSHVNKNIKEWQDN